MNQIEHQVVRVSITILKTTLSVRFPCSINYQLKYDTSVSQSNASYELKSGSCQPHQKLSLEAEVQAIGSSYYDFKAVLNVGLVSANGKVPAGSVTIPLTMNGQLLLTEREETKTIEKCADKFAKVTYRVKIQYIKTNKKNKVGDTLAKSLVKPISGFSSSGSEYSNLKSLFASRRVLAPTTSFASKNKTATQRHTNQIKTTTKTELKSSGDKSDKCISEKESNLGLEEKDNTQSGGENSRMRVHTTTAWQKLSRDNASERQRQDVKYPYPSYQYEDKINKYRSETQDLMFELNSIKQKNKYLERKEREHVQQVRELKEQVQKMKTKCNSAEENNFQLKLCLEEKEKANLRLNEQLKILKDYIEDVKSNSNLQEKKIDYKQSVYSEQARKMTEKYQQSEQERQKLMVEMNNMLSQYEASQKKSQSIYKERERAGIEEKNKLLKKIESLTENIRRLEEQNCDQQSRIQQQLLNMNRQSKSKADLEGQLMQAINKIELLAESNRKLQRQNEERSKQLDQANVRIQQLKPYQKKYSDLEYELNKLRQAQNKLNLKQISQAKSIKDLEASLKEITIARDTALAKNIELSKQLHISKKQLQSKEADIEKLSESIIELKDRNEENKQKHLANYLVLQQKYKQLEGETIYLIRKKESVQNQYEQLKEKYDKNEQNFEEMITRGNQLNNKILKLNQELFSQRQKNKAYQENIKEMQNSIQLMKTEILTKEHKEKELSYSLKAKNQSEYQFNKLIKSKDKQILILKEKQIQFIVAQEESRKKIQQLQCQIKELEIENNVLSRNSRDKINELEEEKNQKTGEYQRLKEEYSYVKNEKQEAESKVTALQIDIMGRNKAFKQKEDEIIFHLEAQKRLSSLLKKKEEQLLVARQEYKQYKLQLASAFQNFTTEFCAKLTDQGSPARQKNSKFQQPGSSNFAQQFLLTFQSKIMKNKRQLISNYRSLIKSQEQNLQLAGNELSKVKQIWKVSEESYEKELEGQKQKYIQLLSLTAAEKNELMDKIGVLEEKHHDLQGEKEKLNYQLNCVNEQLLEYKKLGEEAKAGEMESEKKISALQAEMKQLEKIITNLKKSGASQLSTLQEEHRVVLEKQRNSAKEMQKKIVKLQQQLTGNEKMMKSLENSLSQKSYQLDKNIKNYESAQHTIQQLKQSVKTLKEQLSSKDFSISEISCENEKISKKLSAEIFKNEDLSLQLKKECESYAWLHAENQLHKSQIKNLNATILVHEDIVQKLISTERRNSEKSQCARKQLQQKVISLTSDIELKQFLIQQNQANYNQVKVQLAILMQECSKKKEEILELNNTIDSIKDENLQLQQLSQVLQNEKKQLEREERNMKINIERLTKQCSDSNYLGKALEAERKQNERMKQEVANLTGKVKAAQQQFSQATAEFRRESAIKLNRQQELRKKIRELEKQLSNKTHDFAVESERKKQLWEEERAGLLTQLQTAEEESEALIAIYENLKQQTRKEIQSLTQECAQLTGLVTQKEELLCGKDDLIREEEHKCKFLQAELKNCLQAWQSEKKQMELSKSNKLQSKANRILEEVDQRSQVLLTRIFQSSKKV